jgi:hypothetical protein
MGRQLRADFAEQKNKSSGGVGGGYGEYLRTCQFQFKNYKS